VDSKAIKFGKLENITEEGKLRIKILGIPSDPTRAFTVALGQSKLQTEIEMKKEYTQRIALVSTYGKGDSWVGKLGSSSMSGEVFVETEI
jgi:hypothetical protein